MEGSERILFIDDEPRVCTAFARSIKELGLQVDTASSQAVAEALVAEHEYAVIATDYRMPDIDGFSLIERLRRIQPDTTYMLVSGWCDLALTLEAVNEHGIAFVVPKPWNTEELLSLLRRSLEGYWERVTTRVFQRRMLEGAKAIEAQKESLNTALSRADSLTAEALVNALAVTGHETRAHCQRVTAYSLLIADRMGLSQEEKTSLRQGALLHDIGKIALPEALLTKEGRLDAEEWRIMHTHPLVGAQLLEGLPGLAEAQRIVAEHHERFNGTGYPHFLRGDQISIGARIFAAADTLDAMLSGRPYATAVNLTRARWEIASQRDQQFDPAVVAAFLSIPDIQILEVQAAHPEEPRQSVTQPLLNNVTKIGVA